MKFLKKILLAAALILGGVALFFVLIVGIIFVFPAKTAEKTAFGISFSKIQTENLKLNWQETFLAILDDLKVRNFRLASYWSEIEPQKNQFLWNDLDWQINEVKKREGKIILVLGRKQFRWPECFIPEWAVNLPLEEQRKAVIEFIEKTVKRYKNEKTIWAWQVENEPLFPFGDCPERNKKFWDEEITKVRSLDNSRPIITTDSGEFSFWLNAASRGDIFGTTLYRIVKNRFISGYLSYEFIPASFYQKKANLILFLFPKLKNIIIIELQAEPWALVSVDPLEKQFQTMNLERFKRTVNYAKEIGYPETYFWGAEWWYWLKTKHNQPEFWEAAKTVFNK